MESEEKAAPKRDPLEALKGFSGILPGKFIFATPPVFKEAYPNQPEKWPVYKFKPSDGLDFNNDLDSPDIYQVVGGEQRLAPGKIRIRKLKRGLKGAKNHRDGDTEIPFTADAEGNATDDFLRSMSPDLQKWALGIIDGVDVVSKEESDGLKF